MIGFNLKKTFLITMIVALCLSALSGIIIFLTGEFGRTEGRILLTTLSVAGYSLAGLACSALYDKNRGVEALAGMVTSIIGFLYSVGIIWEIINWSWDSSWKFLLTLIIFSVAFAHACLMLLIESSHRVVQIAVIGTLISIIALALLLMVLIWGENFNEFLIRLIGVVAICDALGTICSPILNKVYKSK